MKTSKTSVKANKAVAAAKAVSTPVATSAAQKSGESHARNKFLRRLQNRKINKLLRRGHKLESGFDPLGAGAKGSPIKGELSPSEIAKKLRRQKARPRNLKNAIERLEKECFSIQADNEEIIKTFLGKNLPEKFKKILKENGNVIESKRRLIKLKHKSLQRICIEEIDFVQ